MFLRLLLLLLLSQAKGDLVYKCNDAENEPDSMKMVAAADGVLGRYTVELCALRNPNATKWVVDLWYYKNETDYEITRPWIHSVGNEDLTSIRDISCSNICYSMDFDLIFAGSYNIYSQFKKESITLQTFHNKFTIKNNLTLEQFKKNQPKIVNKSNGTYISLRWLPGVPVARPFTVTLQHPNNYKVSDISQNCTVSESAYEVSCQFVVSAGCYNAYLQFNPLWYPVLSSKTSIVYSFCKTG